MLGDIGYLPKFGYLATFSPNNANGSFYIKSNVLRKRLNWTLTILLEMSNKLYEPLAYSPSIKIINYNVT